MNEAKPSSDGAPLTVGGGAAEDAPSPEAPAQPTAAEPVAPAAEPAPLPATAIGYFPPVAGLVSPPAEPAPAAAETAAPLAPETVDASPLLAPVAPTELVPAGATLGEQPPALTEATAAIDAAAPSATAGGPPEGADAGSPAPPGDANSPPPLRARWAYPLAFLSGFLYFVAFPGIDVWPLAFVALVPLIVALRGQTRRRATGLGWLAGLVMTSFGFYWLVGMLQEFSGFPTIACVALMLVLCAYQGGRIGLCGFLHACAERRGWPGKVAFALAFATSELVFPLLFPWTYAATVHQIPALQQHAELFGPIGVTLVLVAANLALAEPILARLERRRIRWLQAGLLLAAPILALIYGAVRIAQVDATVAAAPKGQVGIVQANMGLMQKRERPGVGLRRHLQLSHKLRLKNKLDLVVWSETSVVGAVPEKDARPLLRRELTSRLGVPTLFGSVLRRPVDDERKYVLFNSALLSDERGEICEKCRYDKQYLLMFGEYLPFGETFPVLHTWSPNSGRFTPGKTLHPLPLGKHEVAVFICYEDIIPAFVNSIVGSGNPDLLVNMTNDAWFGDTTEPWIHLALAKLRAVEHRRYLVRSTNSGVSAFVDPVGRVVSHTGTFQQQAISTEIAWLRSSTLYGAIGNAPFWLLALLNLGMCIVPARRLRRRRRPGPTPPPPSAPADPGGAPPASPTAEPGAAEPGAQTPSASADPSPGHPLIVPPDRHE